MADFEKELTPEDREQGMRISLAINKAIQTELGTDIDNANLNQMGIILSALQCVSDSLQKVWGVKNFKLQDKEEKNGGIRDGH